MNLRKSINTNQQVGRCFGFNQESAQVKSLSPTDRFMKDALKGFTWRKYFQNGQVNTSKTRHQKKQYQHCLIVKINFSELQKLTI